LIFATLHSKFTTPGTRYFACRAFVITLVEMFLRYHTIVYLLLFSQAVLSQNNPFAFHHLTEKDGLSSSMVNCFLKDSRGLLWVGTYEGLNRFDGSHFYSFRRTKSPTSIFNNVVHSLCEDKQNNIWGATDGGIFRYDPETNVFKNYSSPNSKNSIVTSNVARAIQNILCDKNGNIWATGVWTILKFNPAKDTFEEIGPLTQHYDSLTLYSVRKHGLVEDPSGKGLWLATRIGLHYYDFATNRFTSYKNDNDPLFAKRNVAALARSQSGQCWFYDNSLGRIVGFDPATKKITRSIDMMQSMPGAFGGALFEDSENRIWFSSWNAGIAVIDYKRNSFTRFQN
jgi:ligand-binding sensor domain-containing protein